MTSNIQSVSGNSSVPQGPASSSESSVGQGQKHVDSILMYCSYFSYCDDNKIRSIFCTGKPYESSGMIRLLNNLACK